MTEDSGCRAQVLRLDVLCYVLCVILKSMQLHLGVKNSLEETTNNVWVFAAAAIPGEGIPTAAGWICGSPLNVHSKYSISHGRGNLENCKITTAANLLQEVDEWCTKLRTFTLTSLQKPLPTHCWLAQ